jgi:predicted RecA/RadA family phage recombinase
MATNRVHGGERIRVLFSVAHRAGDLVWEKGFYGVVEENQVAGRYGYLILRDVWTLAGVPATVAMGTKLYASATAQATTLPLIAAASTGYNAVGRTIATGNASVARVALFWQNEY